MKFQNQTPFFLSIISILLLLSISSEINNINNNVQFAAFALDEKNIAFPDKYGLNAALNYANSSSIGESQSNSNNINNLDNTNYNDNLQTQSNDQSLNFSITDMPGEETPILMYVINSDNSTVSVRHIYKYCDSYNFGG